MGGRSPRSIEPWEMLARVKYVLSPIPPRPALAIRLDPSRLRVAGPFPSLTDLLTMLADVVNSAKGAATSSTYHTDHGDVAISAGRSTPPDRVSKAQGTRYVKQPAHLHLLCCHCPLADLGPRKQRYPLPKRPHLWPLPIRRSGLRIQP